MLKRNLPMNLVDIEYLLSPRVNYDNNLPFDFKMEYRTSILS